MTANLILIFVLKAFQCWPPIINLISLGINWSLFTKKAHLSTYTIIKYPAQKYYIMSKVKIIAFFNWWPLNFEEWWLFPLFNSITHISTRGRITIYLQSAYYWPWLFRSSHHCAPVLYVRPQPASPRTLAHISAQIYQIKVMKMVMLRYHYIIWLPTKFLIRLKCFQPDTDIGCLADK